MPADSAPQPQNRRVNGTARETILVTVSNAGDDTHGKAKLTDDVGKAERIVASLVKSGIKPEAVSALRATEVPLTVSYEWTVEIGGNARQRSRPRRASSPSGNASGLLSRANEFLQEIMPESPLQLRFDRIVWLGLWGASLLILGILLVASLSGGSAREFVVGGQASPSADGSSVSDGENGWTPALPGASPGLSASVPQASCLQGAVNNCQCQDFKSQGEAQKFFTTYPPPVRQPVDPDGDGLVCEWLPKITPSPR